MPLAPTIIVVIILLILAIPFSFGKGASLISGFNTLPSYKKKNINEVKLTKDMALFLYSLCALIIFWHLLAMYGLNVNTMLISAFIIILIVIVNILLIRKSKNNE